MMLWRRSLTPGSPELDFGAVQSPISSAKCLSGNSNEEKELKAAEHRVGVEPATSRLRVMQNAAVLPDILVHL